MSNYRENLVALGWDPDEVQGVGSEELFDAVVAWGGVSDASRRLDAQHAAGADHVEIEVLGDSFSELLAGYQALAPLVR